MIEVKNERYDVETNEYVYDVEMSLEEMEKFRELADAKGMTVEQYCRYCIEEAVKHPEILKTIVEGEKKKGTL